MGAMVALCEVAPCDGLQNEARILAPVLRAELIRRLLRCGLRRVEVASFVHELRVPAMSAAEELASMLPGAPGVAYAGQVVDERGYERLARTRLNEVRMLVSCTETFGQRNAYASVEDAVARVGRVVVRAREDGRRVTVTLAVAFGCPYEGRIPEHRVLALAERLCALGPDGLVLADTIGIAAPAEVRRLTSAVAALGTPLGVHLHDTHSTAVANTYAALEGGATVVDAAVGGAGGCPFAPGAAGNLATEDIIYALERDGVDTGIDLDGLVTVAEWLGKLLGHELAGRVHRVPRPLARATSEAVTLCTRSRGAA
jgi:isopropylmalate/homocitrate/citramalate synthase